MKKAMSLVAMSAVLCGSAFAQTTPSAPPGSDSTYPSTTSPGTTSPGTTSPGAGRSAVVSFDSLDKNKDAKINKDEAKGSVAVVAAFDTADKNGDSALSKTEFDAYFNMR